MFGKVEDNNDSYYTSEQLALLMAVDPDFKDKYEKEQDLKNQIDYEKLKEKSDAFDQRMPLDGSTANMMDLDYGEELEKIPKSGNGVCAPNGGLAILPIAKIVAPLAIKGIAKGIKWLIKRKKNKNKNKNAINAANPNNTPVGNGICAPNGKGVKEAVNNYIMRNRTSFNHFNNNLMRMNGRQAWRNVLKYGKNMTKDILKNYLNNPVDNNELNKKVKRSFNKFVPYKFKKMIKSSNKPLKEYGRLNNFMMAKPVIKYGINEVAGSGPIAQKAYKMSKKHLMNNYGYYGNGKLSWKKIKKLVKYGLSKGMEYLKGFGDKFISGDTVKNAVSGVLNNFEIFDKLGIDPDDIGDIGQSLVKKGYDKGYDTLQGKLKDDDYEDVENDIENVKSKYKKGKEMLNNPNYFKEKINNSINDMKEGESRVLDNGNLVGKFGFGLKAPNYSKNGYGATQKKKGVAPAVRLIVK